MCRFSGLFKHLFYVQIDIFFSFFVKGSSVNNQKVHILLILTGKNATKWLQWCILGFKVCQFQWHRFLVSTISGSWKITNSGKNFTFCWFWLEKMHQNDLSGTYLGCDVCQIQWCRCLVSIISGSWKIKNSGRNFTFCWFWLGKVHWNGLGGAY